MSKFEIKAFIDGDNLSHVEATCAFLQAIGGEAPEVKPTEEAKPVKRTRRKAIPAEETAVYVRAVDIRAEEIENAVEKRAKEIENAVEKRAKDAEKAVEKEETEVDTDSMDKPIAVQDIRKVMREKAIDNKLIIKKELNRLGRPNVSSLFEEERKPFIDFLNSLD